MNGHPFKQRQEYNIDWNKVINISKDCGMISMEERLSSDILMRVSRWSKKTSYDDWLNNDYIKEYINQRDSYNTKHKITSKLFLMEI